MSLVEVTRGDGPLVLGLPHTGTDVPDDVAAALNDRGHAIADTDWHIHRLYEGLAPDLTTVRATTHRYVIDVNRDPSGASLYPGQNTTGLCPTIDFEGHAIYREGKEPDEGEIERRRTTFHAPYHEALSAELARVRDCHGVAILYDCHSIRSRIPFLFQGTLPDFNVGTDGARTCDASVDRAVVDACAAADAYSHILNGRFRGGWTTRHYGRPAEGIHAIQMELSQSTYMDEAPPFSYRDDLAQGLRPILAEILSRLAALAPDLARAR